MKLPDFEDLYQFLKKHYKHSRFEGYDEFKDLSGREYAEMVTKGSMEQLEKLGHAFISPHEAHIGNDIMFDCELSILNEDRPPEERTEYNHNKGHLTHLF